MTCAERRPALVAYLDAELPAAERAELESHLSGCAACRQALAAEQRLSAQLAALPPVEPPRDFEARFWARIAREADPEPRGLGAWLARLRSPRGWVALGGVAAAALALILVLRSGSQPAPPGPADWQIAADEEDFELLQDPDLDIAEVADILQKMDAQGGGPERGPG